MLEEPKGYGVDRICVFECQGEPWATMSPAGLRKGACSVYIQEKQTNSSITQLSNH